MNDKTFRRWLIERNKLKRYLYTARKTERESARYETRIRGRRQALETAIRAIDRLF